MSFTPAADVESRFQYGFQIIRECLETKGKEINEENSRLKQLNQTQKKQISTLELENSELKKKLNEIETRMNSLKSENARLSEKNNALQKVCTDLERFKKNIVSMVEGNDNSDPLFSNFQRQLELEKMVVNGNTTPPLGGSSTPSTKSHFRQTTATATNYSAHSGFATRTKEEVIAENANELYREIREVLAQQQFIEFAEQINKLNNGEQSIEDTLTNISKMLKDVRLFERLKLLIRQASEEKFK